MSRPFPSVSRRTMHEEVAGHLEELIVSGQLPPGHLLPSELELADQMGVSRTVIRDATRTLAAKGLVVVRHGAGTFVSAPGGESFLSILVPILRRRNCTIGDLVDFRVMIEPPIAAMAATRATDAEIGQLVQMLEDYPREWDGPDEGFRETISRNIAFHLHLMRAAHNPVVDGLIGPLTEIILGTQGPPNGSSPEEFASQHTPIVDALRRRDREGAHKAMLGHFTYHCVGSHFLEVKDKLLGPDFF